LAALHEAATMIITSADPEAERERVGPTIAVLIEGLRRR
jgi:hypothetical protein